MKIKLMLALLILLIASDAAAVKPYRSFLPVMVQRDPLCGYNAELDRWWCYATE